MVDRYLCWHSFQVWIYFGSGTWFIWRR